MRNYKVAAYIFLFGVLTLYAAVFRPAPKQVYSPAEILGAQTGLTLFIQPGAGRDPVLEAINLAQNEILVEVYLLSDKEVIGALEEAKNRGVKVQIMLEQHPFGGGKPTLLTGVETKWSSPAFALTHEKAIIIDGREVCILNQNLTTAAFTKNREYDVCDNNNEDVSDVKGIFTADWKRESFSPTAPNLVVSPNNSRAKLTALIMGAKKSLDLEIEVLEDRELVKLLTDKANTLSVRIIMPTGIKNKIVSGAQTKTLARPYVHAKLLLVDKERAYVGSVNFSSQSLDKNRELGILISQPDVIEKLSNTFESDWLASQVYN